MGAGRAIAAAARAAARNKGIQGIAVSAGAAGARKVRPFAQRRYAAWRDRRVDRDGAVQLARQLNARYSEDPIIDGGRHFVLW